MAIRARDITYSEEAFALIEVKGVIYVVAAGAAPKIKRELAEQMIFTSAEGPLTEFLERVSAFVFDIPNGKVIKPLP